MTQHKPKNVNKWQFSRRFLPLLLILVLSFAMMACEKEDPTPTVEGIAMGTWADYKMVAEKDGKLHDVQVRMTSVTQNQDTVMSAIQNYNLSAYGSTISEDPGAEELQYVMANYEVKFPDDFPDSEWGITDVMPVFTMASEHGNDVYVLDNTQFSGLTETWQIGPPEEGYEFYAGDTYKGTFVFRMLPGYQDYRFCLTYTDDAGTEQVLYFAPK